MIEIDECAVATAFGVKGFSLASLYTEDGVLCVEPAEGAPVTLEEIVFIAHFARSIGCREAIMTIDGCPYLLEI